METQNSSTIAKTPRTLWDNAKTDKKNVETNTDQRTCACHNCLQFELLDANVLNNFEPANQQTTVNYKKAINYINSCHAIINEYLSKTYNQRCLKCNAKSEDSINVSMPILPDFMTLLYSLTALNKDGLCSKCFHEDYTSNSRFEEDSLRRNKKSPFRPQTTHSKCRKSESPEQIYNSARSSESSETTRNCERKKTRSSHCASRKNNRSREDKHPQTKKDSGCYLPNNKKSATIIASSKNKAKIHTNTAQNYRKLTARTIHSVSVTDESDNEHITVSTNAVGNFKKKYKCKGNNFEMGDAPTDFDTNLQKNSSGTETAVTDDSKHQKNNKEHDNLQALYAIIGQQLLQGNQMMPVQKVIDILKNQAFSPSTVSESQKDDSARESTSNVETHRDSSTESQQSHENIGNCLKRYKAINKDKNHDLPPPLVSQRDIENYTTELMETLQENSSQETTPRYINTESTTQSLDLEEDYCTSDKRDESRKLSQTRIPTAVRNQLKKSSLAKQTSQHKDAQNLVSSYSDEYQAATFDDQRECGDCGNFILNTQEALQQQLFSSVQRKVETNSPILQQDLPPYVVQQKRSDHFVCNRQRRKEKGRNVYGGSIQQSYYEQNMSNIQNIPEEEDEKIKKLKQQPEKEKLSSVSMKSRTDSSEIETDRDEIIKQFTPKKIIIDSSGTTTKMKCMHK